MKSVSCSNQSYNYLDRPMPVLEIGRNENTSTVNEGDTVYFQCNMKANPWVESVVWRHNVS